MQKGKLIKIDGVWMLELPIEAAIALGGQEGLVVNLELTAEGVSAETTAPDKDFLLAAAHEFAENRGAFNKLSKE